MSSKSKRLGSLADVFQAEKLEGTIRKIRLDKILPSENQPRQDRKKGIEDLARSLDKDGLLQPIIVTKQNPEDENYKIVAGERRYHAAKQLGWAEIECKILDRDEKETFRLAIIENLQRENLSPYEEVEAMSHLKNSFKYTDQELGTLFGKSRSYMTELLGISNLSKEELRSCKEAGIESKNLLIQAVAASRKGTFSEFLNLFQRGTLKTVKDAKSFNREEENSFTPKVTSATNPKVSNLNSTEYKITKKQGLIQISSDNEELLGNIFKLIKKEIRKKFNSI
ncbi:ParB/RepB/Spo0J family partition protein [Leptospira borgpetersenii]|uniref:ParB/RepB/Spo0J family partition protein n=1 Tax=Leptospira borgpetersenii TaxID=174 RepID=UPI00077360BF|nr:ParB/RepB/Spo0J family partition protein [Leptospira borgpetersenii]MBE8362642.1 ParB/RepB/Spo0J family partition protein [Leptospira borgpetersenii serovar Balcanica]MBE8368370.1 ParB/RepB/Spo0J family partition protein [Leptospira borgpetersenii serovar Balcanica]MBE8399744.1 ParB/RepB/Spo0J family partition protein [Leptospira borgpetersenii serovar Tarassovi]MBE8402855.1 ParB/RepB/Spo0J family partition protein [Leptospira borgpetersenii serovar Tarassovi]MBE8405906.1 ParB/RepB/Spo0J fa